MPTGNLLMPTYLYRNVYASPDDVAMVVDDTKDAWENFLFTDGKPDLNIAPTKAEKEAGPIICGVSYIDGAKGKNFYFIDKCRSLVLDVDLWDKKAPYSIEDFKSCLEIFAL